MKIIKKSRETTYTLWGLINVLFISFLLCTVASSVSAAPQLLLMKTVEFDLKNTVPTQKTLAQVKGYFKKGDGGGGIFRWVGNTNPTPTIDGGVVIGAVDSFGVLQGKWIRETNSSYVNVRWFGVHDDIAMDDSAAIQAAINYAATDNAISRIIHFPKGRYYANEIDWWPLTGLHGEGIGQSLIIYNGAGGPGSTLFNVPLGGHATETLEGLSLIGTTNPSPTSITSPSELADHLLVLQSTIKPAQIDNNAIFRNLQFALTNSDAIQVNDGWVNFHTDTIRFDSIGGYGIRLRTVPGQDTAPFSIRNFTMDNNIDSDYTNNDSNAPWGKGFLRVDDGGHNNTPGLFKLDSGRLEFNRPLVPVENGTVAAIYLQHAAGAGEEYSLEHNSIHISKFINGGSYVHSETRSRNVFTNMTFGLRSNSFLYSDDAHLADVEANNFNFIRVFNTQPGLGRPGVFGNNGPNPLSLSPNTFTQVPFSNVKDDNSEWNQAGTPNQWVCRVAGRYLVSFQTGVSGIVLGKWVQGRVHLNGTARAVAFNTSTSDTIPTFVTVPYTVDLSVGDVIDFYVMHNDTTTRNIAPGEIYTKMSITRIP
jgi:pectate lyase-like protein